jgi:hypothetical protein
MFVRQTNCILIEDTVEEAAPETPVADDKLKLKSR